MHLLSPWAQGFGGQITIRIEEDSNTIIQNVFEAEIPHLLCLTMALD